jgi:hypothetical protein
MLTFEPEQGYTEVFEPNYNTMSLMVEAKTACNEVYLKTGANASRTYNMRFCRAATAEEVERYTALKLLSNIARHTFHTAHTGRSLRHPKTRHSSIYMPEHRSKVAVRTY